MSDAQKWGQVVAQAWSDDSYKQRLLADPAAVMAEQGLTPPTDKQLRIVEDTADTVHVVLPAKPDELSDEELDQAAGGQAYLIACWTKG
jgi:Nitrile hydratase, alpha chain